MNMTKLNATAATLTKNRTPDSVSPFSGMCATCVEGCLGMCEIGKSAIRGSEVIYPQPFGILTAASEKNYPVDLSHFTVLGTPCGAVGVPADSEHATFPAVGLEVKVGAGKGIKHRLPFIIPGLGSTDVAKNNWDGLAIGAAITGTSLTIGENVCGMDPGTKFKRDRVESSPDLENRVNLFKKWQRDGYGEIIVQSNVEDTKLGVLEYALNKLKVRVVELKWGQGAKDIGGEVKIKDLKKAQTLYERGYIVLPNPTDPNVIKAFNAGAFKEFERHSRLGMVTEESFGARVKELRDMGAEFVFLKTGAYRPADLARAVKYASKYGIDLLTIDGAGGGTGMSPWRMMNEWGVPSVELWSLAYKYGCMLVEQGERVPDMAFAGGITMEDQIAKALALGAPFVKLVGMARSPLAAAMVGKTVGNHISGGKMPVYYERFGKGLTDIFAYALPLKQQYGSRFKDLAPGAIGVYSYYMRLAQGLRQLMAGNRKFDLKYVTRDDIASLTHEAEEISGIPYIMDVDKGVAEAIMRGKMS